MSTVRPVLTEDELGSAGWHTLHELARQRRRRPRDQATQLIRYALYHALAGDDVELSQTRLDALLNHQLEPVA